MGLDSFFSPIDSLFSEKFSKDGADSLALRYLFATARRGDLLVRVVGKKIFPNYIGEEKAIADSFSKLSKDLIENKSSPIIKRGNSFYLAKNFFLEGEIVSNLKRLLGEKGGPFDKKRWELFLSKRSLLPSQKMAIEVALKNRLSFIFGGPGTGKTFTALHLIEFVEESMGSSPHRIVITAPTGRAAENLMERVEGAVSNISSQTLHSLLRVDDGDYIDANFIIVDESSMMDVGILKKLLEKTGRDSHLVLIGDPDQLPPVESGNIFALFKDSIFKNFSCELKEPMRSKKERLSLLASSVRRGDFSSFKDSLGWEEIPQERWEERIFNFVDRFFFKNDAEIFSKFRILSSNREGRYGVNNLNQMIFEYLKDRFQNNLKVPIIITKNDYNLGLYNGTMGIWEVGAKYAYFKEKKIPYYMLKSVEYAFALSIHKSQGSEFDDVLVIVSDDRFFKRELLYTAVTRAKKGVEILSKEETLFRIIKRGQSIESALVERFIKK